MYFWQYQIGFGDDTKEPVLFGRNIVVNKSGQPPKEPGYATRSYDESHVESDEFHEPESHDSESHESDK